jgi:hypothetical protein
MNLLLALVLVLVLVLMLALVLLLNLHVAYNVYTIVPPKLRCDPFRLLPQHEDTASSC